MKEKYHTDLNRKPSGYDAKTDRNHTLHLRFIYGPSTVHLRLRRQNGAIWAPPSNVTQPL